MSDAGKVLIGGDEATPDFFRELEANEALEELTIWSGGLRNEDLEPLRRLTGLKGLCLGEMRIDDNVFEHLRGLRKLEYLNLAYTGIRGDFSTLTGLPLRDVRLEGCRLVGDLCAASLATFPTLRNVEIHMTGLTDAGVKLLAALPLETLWLGPRVTDEGMAAVSRIGSLKHLDVCAHMVNDEGVPALSKLRNLEVLWLCRCNVTDACIPALSGLQSLRELNVNDTAITAAGLNRLRKALPNTRFVAPD